MSEQRKKDYTKYLFDGEKYGKGRLVLAVLTKYTTENPGISFNDLKIVFSDCLQGESDMQFSDTQVVLSKIEEIKTGEKKRFFTEDEEVIQIKGCKIAVSREWNYQNIQNFIDAAAKSGYVITAVE